MKCRVAESKRSQVVRMVQLLRQVSLICANTAVKQHASFKIAFRISTGISSSCLGRVVLSNSAVTTPSTSWPSKEGAWLVMVACRRPLWRFGEAAMGLSYERGMPKHHTRAFALVSTVMGCTAGQKYCSTTTKTPVHM